MQTNSLIFHNLQQGLALYADDLVLMSRTQKELKEMFEKMELKTTDYGLKINERKAKYTEMKSGLTGTKNTIQLGSIAGKAYIFDE